MVRNFKWGILSPGKIAHKFAADLSLVDDAEIVAVCSRSLLRAQSFADQYSIAHSYDHLSDFLEDPEMDIVYIASPHTLHHRHTLAALEAGKHVLCEKPIAMNACQAQEMYTLAEQNGLFLMEAMWTVFLPHFNTLKDLLMLKKIGISQMLVADFSFSVPYDLNNRVINPDLGGGALLDVGIYTVMIALEILGPPAKISAQCIKTAHGVDGSTSVLITHESENLSTLSSSIQQDGTQTVTILGTEGHITIGPRWWSPASLSIHTNQGLEKIKSDTPGHGYHYEADHVQFMIQSGKLYSDRWSPEKSIQLIETLDQIRALIGLEYDHNR